MESFVYLYTATCHDLEDKEATECGLLYGTSYADIFSQINSYYGEDLISLNVEIIDKYAPLTFSANKLPIIKSLLLEDN